MLSVYVIEKKKNSHCQLWTNYRLFIVRVNPYTQKSGSKIDIYESTK
jgi:hypothetical protein